MFIPLLVTAPFAAALIALSLPSRWLRRASRPAVKAPEPEPAAAVKPARAPVRPSAAMTGPFAYDNGVMTDPVTQPDQEAEQ